MELLPPLPVLSTSTILGALTASDLKDRNSPWAPPSPQPAPTGISGFLQDGQTPISPAHTPPVGVGEARSVLQSVPWPPGPFQARLPEFPFILPPRRLCPLPQLPVPPIFQGPPPPQSYLLCKALSSPHLGVSLSSLSPEASLKTFGIIVHEAELFSQNQNFSGASGSVPRPLPFCYSILACCAQGVVFAGLGESRARGCLREWSAPLASQL